jgi:FAD-dependent urate hydroxylase
LAIEDSVVLAKCLQDLPTTEEAFNTYELLRRDRVERVVAHGAKGSNTKVAGPFGRHLRDLVFPMILKKLASQGAESLAWMHDYHIDWSSSVTGSAPVANHG